MFEIGSSLREARMRQKLDLSQVEQATHIRGRYLGALEDERFDLLPGPAYAKGFLRTYAEYLGLDGQRFVDEYNSRFAPTEEPPPAPPVRFRRRRLARDPRLVVLPVALILALLGWRLASTRGHHTAFRPPPSHTASTTAPPTSTRTVTTTPATARLVLTATRGPCWISVRLGSKTGAFLYEKTLEPGQSARFAATRLWIRIGAPWNLDATLNGKATPLPGSTGNVIVTTSGVRTG